MKFDDLIDSHLKYGIHKEDIIQRNSYEDISTNVVIAPWWDHSIFEQFDLNVVPITERIYRIIGENIEFTFIEMKMIGAPALLETILPLGLTKCKRILFIGSAGALNDKIQIGDIVIPSYSICGDGSSRYLNKNLEDEFLKKEYPYGNFINQVGMSCKNITGSCVIVPNYSIDTVFAQFHMIPMIQKIGAKTIEMETAALFKASKVMKITAAAIFVISDNVSLNKTLYQGRTQTEKEKKNYSKNVIIPKIIIDLFTKK